MTPAEREGLIAAVQRNCDIADARHADELTLCIYLLQMREFCRWDLGIALHESLPRAQVGDWIAAREARWDELDGQDFGALPVPAVAQAQSHAPATARSVDPFDADALNAALIPQGLLYGAGLVGKARPVFFLAELHDQRARAGLRVQIGGRELARGLLAPPAALGAALDGPVVVRRTAMARWTWERWEAYTLKPRPASAFGAAVRAYRLDADFAQALPRCLHDLTETAILHELGEHQAGQWLGPDWRALRRDLPAGRPSLTAAAVRDHLADLGHTLPALLDAGAQAALHLWFGTYEGLRQHLMPGLPLAHAAWRDGDGGHALRTACRAGLAHFQALCTRALAAHRAGQPAAPVLLADDAVCTWPKPRG